MEKELQAYRAAKKILLNYIGTFSDEQLNKALSAESWSTIQVCHHLLAIEEGLHGMLASRKDKLDGFSEMKLKAKFNYFVLWVVFQFPSLKFRAPDFVADVPEKGTLKDLLERWSLADSNLESLLLSLSPSQLNKAFFTHPALGRLNIIYMLNFSTLHLHRHFAQIKRILKNV